MIPSTPQVLRKFKLKSTKNCVNIFESSEENLNYHAVVERLGIPRGLGSFHSTAFSKSSYLRSITSRLLTTSINNLHFWSPQPSFLVSTGMFLTIRNILGAAGLSKSGVENSTNPLCCKLLVSSRERVKK